jgi:hypothetical protein
MTDHNAWEELAAGHALNALEPADEQAFAEHLRGCDRCRRDLAALRGVTGELAYAAEPAEPPADLGRRIMAAAAAERPAVFPGTPPALDRPAQRRARRVWQPTFDLASLATAAAVVLVVALGGWNLMLRADVEARRAALTRRDAALSCLASPDSARVELTSGNERHGAACVAGERAYVVAERLAPNDRSSSVYVLWWQDANATMHAVEKFDVEGTRTAVYELPIHVATSDVRGLAISLEPGRALPERPTRPVATGAVPT